MKIIEAAAAAARSAKDACGRINNQRTFVEETALFSIFNCSISTVFLLFHA